MTVKQSKFMTEYKREVRDALKRKKAKGHEPKLFRLYDKSLHPADDAAGKGMIFTSFFHQTHIADEDRKGMMKLLVENITPVVKDDIVDGFKDDGREGNLEKDADKVIYRLIHERVHDVIHEAAESIFRKYLKGQNYEDSDGEDAMDETEKEEARAERAKEAAKQREYEAELWYAQMNGDAPPEKPVELIEAEEEEEEYEEEEDEEDEE